MEGFKKLKEKDVPTVLPVFLLFILIAAVYANSLNNPFHYDDFYFIVNNDWIPHLGSLGKLFNRRMYFETFGQPTYRPVTFILFILLRKICGLVPAYWRLFNLSLLLAVSSLLYYVLRRFRLSVVISLLSACLFAVHTVHTTSINMISANAEMIGAFFCLLSFYWYFKKGLAYKFGAALMLLTSLFVKETFIVLPVLCFIFAWWEEGQNFRFRRFLVNQTGYLLAIIFFFIINFVIMTNPDKAAATYPGGSLFSALTTFSVVLIHYLKISFVPVNLTPIYDFPVYTSLFDRQVMSSVSILAVIAGVTGYGLYMRRAFALFLGWFFLFLLPVSNIIPFWAVLNEWYLFMPLMGLIPAVLLGIDELLKKLIPQQGNILPIAGLLFLLFLSILTVKRNQVWQSHVLIARATLKVTPNTAAPHLWLGDYYYGQGEYDKALKEYKLVTMFGRSYQKPQDYYNIGKSCLALGDYKNARVNFEKAVAKKSEYRRQSEYFDDVFNLGTICFKLGDYAAASRYWEEALRMRPAYRDAYYNLKLAYEKLGLTDKARAIKQRYLKPGR